MRRGKKGNINLHSSLIFSKFSLQLKPRSGSLGSNNTLYCTQTFTSEEIKLYVFKLQKNYKVVRNERSYRKNASNEQLMKDKFQKGDKRIRRIVTKNAL